MRLFSGDFALSRSFPKFIPQTSSGLKRGPPFLSIMLLFLMVRPAVLSVVQPPTSGGRYILIPDLK